MANTQTSTIDVSKEQIKRNHLSPWIKNHIITDRICYGTSIS